MILKETQKVRINLHQSRYFFVLFSILLLVFGLSGCLYRLPLVQGVPFESSVRQSITVGMTRQTVYQLLGTPNVIDIFQPRCVGYFFISSQQTDFFWQTKKKYQEQGKLWLCFEKNDLLVSIQ